MNKPNDAIMGDALYDWKRGSFGERTGWLGYDKEGHVVAFIADYKGFQSDRPLASGKDGQ